MMIRRFFYDTIIYLKDKIMLANEENLNKNALANKTLENDGSPQVLFIMISILKYKKIFHFNNLSKMKHLNLEI